MNRRSFFARMLAGACAASFRFLPMPRLPEPLEPALPSLTFGLDAFVEDACGRNLTKMGMDQFNLALLMVHGHAPDDLIDQDQKVCLHCGNKWTHVDLLQHALLVEDCKSVEPWAWFFHRNTAPR